MPKSLSPMLLKAMASAALLTAAASACAAPAPSYAVSGRIAAPDGGWDYAEVDPATNRVYVARADSVTVVDLDKAHRLSAFGPVVRSHAVVLIPDRNELLVTSGRDNSVRLFDSKGGRQTASIPVGTNPDAAFYDPGRHTAVILNAGSGTVSEIDVPTARVTRTIALKAGLEFGLLGPNNRLFVNNEDANEIEVADLATGNVEPAIAMPGCEGPTGLGLDPAAQRLISACANGKAAIVDLASRRTIWLIDIGRGPDAVIVDRARGLAFIPCGRDGVLEILALGDGAHPVHKLETIKTEIGARTGGLDPRDGTLYLPTAEFPPPAPGATGRPAAKPGSFHLVVVSRRR